MDKATGYPQRRNAAIYAESWDSPMSELEKTKFLTTAARGHKDLGCMFLCSAYRNFGGYQLQYETPKEGARPSKGNNIFSSQCYLEGLLPLPWLVTRYMTYAAKSNGPIHKVEPLNWSPFKLMVVFPDLPRDMALRSSSPTLTLLSSFELASLAMLVITTVVRSSKLWY